MNGERLLAFIPAIVLTTAFLGAGVVPGRWEKVDSLAPHTGLRVVLASHEQIIASFVNSDPKTLTLMDPAGRERRVEKSEVVLVETSRSMPDSGVNGALIGAGAGLGLALLSRGEVEAGGGSKGALFACAALFGGGLGFLIDRAIKHPELLFVAK